MFWAETSFLSEKFQFLEVEFSIYLHRRVFVIVYLEIPNTYKRRNSEPRFHWDSSYNRSTRNLGFIKILHMADLLGTSVSLTLFIWQIYSEPRFHWDSLYGRSTRNLGLIETLYMADLLGTSVSLRLFIWQIYSEPRFHLDSSYGRSTRNLGLIETLYMADLLGTSVSLGLFIWQICSSQIEFHSHLTPSSGLNGTWCFPICQRKVNEPRETKNKTSLWWCSLRLYCRHTVLDTSYSEIKYYFNYKSSPSGKHTYIILIPLNPTFI